MVMGFKRSMVRVVGEFVADKKAQTEWSSVYMLLILAIVAVVLVAVIKPSFRESVKVGSGQEGVESEEVSD